ncbi:hypothetical protein M0208_00445 [Sphingomonas sp. SUN019]|uniref:hypothetical protein n=1 Tax=Sphingomonas sp. SUN019 TaxID=2937788 RepID=UPI002164F007|nr:hypothetical protein [Sphingomonas sp. SUN019]UVO49064.1 hypothetical protein M0208_00445 [Sphingomonas sp. SUN019]
MSPSAPLWLARPSRYAGLPSLRARWLLAALAVLLLASLTSLATPGPPPVSGDPAARGEDRADEILYETIVEGVRHGGNYYLVAADALRTGGYPMRPFVTFRLPTLATVQAGMSPVAAALLLYALAVGTLFAWYVRLGGVFQRATIHLIAVGLAAAGMASAVQVELVAFHEIWAGLLIALSLAARRPGRWQTAVALGLAAMLIRETAALYVGIMAVLAFVEGERREAFGWVAATAVFAVAVLLHAQAVADVVRPLDQASPGWAGMLGVGFAIKALTLTTALALAPPALAALLAGLAIVGWSAWRDPLAVRAFATLCAYVALIALFGRTDTFYWALLVAPLVPLGLVFAVDGVRDLIRAALDRRRITVTRTAR